MYLSAESLTILMVHLIAHWGKLCSAFGDVNIVVIAIGDNPIYGFYAQIPMYDVTMERLQKKYPVALSNATMHVIHEPGQIICPDAAAMMYNVAGKLHSLMHNLTGLTVIISPGCSLEVIALGDFARDQALTDKRRFPTVIAYGPPDHPSLALAGKRLLDKFAWTTVTFLCDQLTQYPALAGFYQTACRNFRQMLDSDNAGNKYILYTLSFDSNNTRRTLSDLLQKSKSRCRSKTDLFLIAARG
ncbi:hypothetical protein RvY_16364 [Ramazzottius varieornatus]|uniref:Receptor ligand binding region domain-containing protein n=1 Tax=Ramazzottius varieornatus TaxID=947166 RepID=A0A1D1VY65_RAMVA|nr:hypothetical protein RvY_16364 [Ramazzottius varieornatus]